MMILWDIEFGKKSRKKFFFKIVPPRGGINLQKSPFFAIFQNRIHFHGTGMWSKMVHFFNLLFQTRFLLLVDCYDMLFVAWEGFAAEIQGILGVYTQP